MKRSHSITCKGRDLTFSSSTKGLVRALPHADGAVVPAADHELAARRHRKQGLTPVPCPVGRRLLRSGQSLSIG